MNRATPALLALLLVCSLPAMSVLAAGPDVENEPDDISAAAADPSDASVVDATVQQDALQQVAPVDADNTTNRLELSGEIRSNYTNHASDLGAMLAGTDDELRIDHEQYVLVDSEFNAATADEREEMVRTAYERLTERADALETREREAVRAHANGERTTAELVQTLSRNANEAAILSIAFDELSERTDLISGYSLSVEDDQDELEMHRTTIRTRLGATQDAGTDRTVAVQTSQDGYTLSMIDGNYVRETVRFDNRDTNQSVQFEDLTDAYDSAESMYPWVFETRESSAKASGLTEAQLFLIEVSHGHGQLDVYLDGGTGEVYREIQTLNYNDLPVVEEESWSGDGLDLSINQTPANGPVEVTVTDAATDDPETATVTIDGVEVGETDEDGTLWIVPPAGEYELEAQTATDSVNATVPND